MIVLATDTGGCRIVIASEEDPNVLDDQHSPLLWVEGNVLDITPTRAREIATGLLKWAEENDSK